MKLRKRDYESEELVGALQRQPTKIHPLSNQTENGDRSLISRISEEKGLNGEKMGNKVSDPRISPSIQKVNGGLQMKEMAFDDPLRGLSLQTAAVSTDDALTPKARGSRRVIKGGSDELADSVASEWSSYKASIMQRFASTGTITVSTTFDIISKEPKGQKKSVTAAHLEELEDPNKEAREEVKIISQQEYVTRLRELNDEIAHAWINNERVAALRLTIKVARLLMDTSVPQFYPTLFVLVTDVMDTVGNLVWNRIKKKAEIDDAGNLIATLPVNFTESDVRQEAKDTCNNWFYKIGCIRELLPRIYLEIAILRCVHFLERDPPVASFQRLTMMMRGLSDPLASAYAHLYLARRGQALLPVDTGPSDALKSYGALMSFLQLPVPAAIPQSHRGYLINGLNDYLVLFRRVLSGEFDKHISNSGVDRRLYVTLVEPVIEWMMLCIFKHANQEELAHVLHAFGERQPFGLKPGAANAVQDGLDPVSVVVHYLLKQLPATYVGNDALNLSRMVRSSHDLSLPQYLNYRLLGMMLCECCPPRELRLSVLNDVWKVVMKYTDLVEYLTVADVFLDYVLQSCSEMELNIMLRDILKHLRKGVVNDTVLALLESIVFKLITHYTDLTQVLNLSHIVEILDMFCGDTRLSVYKRILSSVSRSNQRVRDPVTRHFLFEQAQVLHDSLDSLSSDDDRRQITRVIARFVQLVDFGQDLEQHLAFLVDCRATFGNMDFLRETVVHVSNWLAVTTLHTVKGSHSKQTVEFVKACLTFNEITIPSISSILPRVYLFLETAEAALMNALLSHTEGLVKSALTCVQELSKTDGHPELGAFYILRGLLSLLDSEPRLTSGRRKVHVLCGLLGTISTVAQERLPYHILNEQVDSNDTLYFGEPSYRKELEDIMVIIVQKLVASLDQAVDKDEVGYQALDVCNALLAAFDVDDQLSTLCNGFLHRASAALTKKNAYLQGTMTYARSRGLDILPT